MRGLVALRALASGGGCWAIGAWLCAWRARILSLGRKGGRRGRCHAVNLPCCHVVILTCCHAGRSTSCDSLAARPAHSRLCMHAAAARSRGSPSRRPSCWPWASLRPIHPHPTIFIERGAKPERVASSGPATFLPSERRPLSGSAYFGDPKGTAAAERFSLGSGGYGCWHRMPPRTLSRHQQGTRPSYQGVAVVRKLAASKWVVQR